MMRAGVASGAGRGVRSARLGRNGPQRKDPRPDRTSLDPPAKPLLPASALAPARTPTHLSVSPLCPPALLPPWPPTGHHRRQGHPGSRQGPPVHPARRPRGVHGREGHAAGGAARPGLGGAHRQEGAAHRWASPGASPSANPPVSTHSVSTGVPPTRPPRLLPAPWRECRGSAPLPACTAAGT